MIDRRICLPLLIISVFLVFLASIVNAQLTENDIITIVTNQNELDYVKSNINNATDNFTPILKDALLGNYKIYHIKIGDYDIGAEINDGKIARLWPGIPDSPTDVIKTDYDTVLKISNSENPITTASEIITKGKIKIEKAESSNFGSSLKSRSLSIWIVSIVGFVVVIVIIILVIKAVKKKKVKEQKEIVEPHKEVETTETIEKSTFDKLLEEHEKHVEEENRGEEKQ
jgi:large-conductance mechanosensitive channel